MYTEKLMGKITPERKSLNNAFISPLTIKLDFMTIT
jgi:hypothetical protein